VGTRTPTQVKNYFYDNKKTIARQKESKEKIPKAGAKAVKAAALPADHADTMKGTKKKKTKEGKKEASCETPSKVGPKKLSPSTDETDASRLGAASTENSRDSYSETELSRAGSELVVQPGSGQDQEEEYRQHQFRLHQQQQQLQLQQQQQLQLQQQQLERLVQQQRQDEIYRQQMQQEELYRQHLRQQEMLQAAQHAQQLQQQHQHGHHQNQQYTEPGQNWNQLDRKCSHGCIPLSQCMPPPAKMQQLISCPLLDRQLHNLQSMLALRHSDQTPPMLQHYPIHHQQQVGGYGNTGGGAPQQQLHNSSDLGHVYQAAVAAGIPASALDMALAAARGGGGQPQQQMFSRNENQHQTMSLELLRRLTQQQQHQQGDGNWYGDDPYQR